ncbi:anti-sigma regulatory factor [Isachenkonia alkalipeptolytica]|uniref:Anti-sigma regulatory factor n=2 Tax=Isachenkonia alkalipeptolytica TaxID=2565777 RepID=A0AA43XM17_9CLOT|nr:anti-sigma regulatory factor [Isachenkonia alkalipeptolytica]
MSAINLEFVVAKEDFSKAGEASSSIKKTLKKLGIDSKIIRKVAIVTYEAEMNIVIHSIGGKIMVDIDTEKIKIQAIDQGPGIEDTEKAMEVGFSTATQKVRELGFGAGMGLPNIKKNSDNFEISSEINKYTKIESLIYVNP